MGTLSPALLEESLNQGPAYVPLSCGLILISCLTQVNASNRNTPSMHHAWNGNMATYKLNRHISRVSNQYGESLQWYIVEIYHSGLKPSLCKNLTTWPIPDFLLGNEQKKKSLQNVFAWHTQRRRLRGQAWCWVRLWEEQRTEENGESGLLEDWCRLTQWPSRPQNRWGEFGHKHTMETETELSTSINFPGYGYIITRKPPVATYAQRLLNITLLSDLPTSQYQASNDLICLSGVILDMCAKRKKKKTLTLLCRVHMYCRAQNCMYDNTASVLT